MPTKHEVTVDGETIVAVHHGAPSQKWFVCCHGLRSDKSGSYQRRCGRAVEHGYNAVRFDFRGCGESDGAFVESTLSARLADLEAVLEYFDPSSCVLFGSSFGGNVAFHTAAADDRVVAVVTRAPVTDPATFDRYREIVADEGEVRFETGERLDEAFLDDITQYPFAPIADTLDVPVAIFHGDADDSVDVADSYRAAEALETDVLLQTYAREGHRFSPAAERRLLAVTFAWLEAAETV
ncbi:alpha/beta fold hydrolase [Salinadaptatus halalkaliphilus]|uniref:Alpha/beta fold hydrolase n=1 Tax=Salinadaptatus halalkaliphilus TaxID=2419781 RepID=A0A4V3VKS9_9EURY|nr:alpha/beta hydrolase [Salinadaptatus halalkaliphilus]THE62897.1 alpha/beta fold hydrolase [Salinadaptatus halalkaliphilus]